MNQNRTVALVGRPNVGKSRLFNRLAGKRISIVHDQPGVTRDVISEELDQYTLLDTGGIGLTGKMTPEIIQAATEEQAAFAIAAADLILFVTDGRDGFTALDEMVGGMLRLCLPRRPVGIVTMGMQTSLPMPLRSVMM